MVKKLIILLIISMFLNNINLSSTFADNSEKDPVDEQYYKLGYGKLEDVVNKFEKDNKVTVSLPMEYPFDITHSFAKVDNEGKLQLYYLNSRNKQVLKIFLTLNRNLLEVDGEEVVLKGNINAVIKDVGKVKKIDFIKNNLLYSISYYKDNINLTDQDLVNISNSIK
ncbi:hypothetical protein [Metabacillus niabensis]|uniref:hypothetical protein n=1 Tax=Metabacillus niabensis TaxID=324854 RepID=UPI0039A0EF0F